MTDLNMLLSCFREKMSVRRVEVGTGEENDTAPRRNAAVENEERGKEILAGFMRGACDASEGGKNASESFNVNVLRM